SHDGRLAGRGALGRGRRRAAAAGRLRGGGMIDVEERRVEELLAPLRRLEPARLPPQGRPRRRWGGIVAVALPLALLALFVLVRPGRDDGPSPRQVLAPLAAALRAPPP